MQAPIASPSQSGLRTIAGESRPQQPDRATPDPVQSGVIPGRPARDFHPEASPLMDGVPMRGAALSYIDCILVWDGRSTGCTHAKAPQAKLPLCGKGLAYCPAGSTQPGTGWIP